MSNTIDEKVVEMKFDNKNFETAIRAIYDAFVE